MVEVEIDGLELYESQVVHVWTSSFKMKLGGFPILVSFLNDKEGVPSWQISGGDDGQMCLTFKNFKNRQGIGRLKPIKAGEADGFSLYMTFIVETLSYENDERVVNFNFYKGSL